VQFYGRVAAKLARAQRQRLVRTLIAIDHHCTARAARNRLKSKGPATRE
jgi:hypothetical protein